VEQVEFSVIDGIMSSGLHAWKMTKTSNNRDGLIQNLYGAFDDYGVFWFSAIVHFP
jgi:hypothetical protein